MRHNWDSRNSKRISFGPLKQCPKNYIEQGRLDGSTGMNLIPGAGKCLMLAQVRTMACCMNHHPWDIGEVLVYVRRKVSITDSLVWVLQEAVSVLAQL